MGKRLTALALLCALLAGCAPGKKDAQPLSATVLAMDTVMTLTLYPGEGDGGQAAMDGLRQTLEQISGELARQDEGLDKLTKSCCAELTHRAPDPLPLDEK